MCVKFCPKYDKSEEIINKCGLKFSQFWYLHF